jgi:hypothetical protein
MLVIIPDGDLICPNNIPIELWNTFKSIYNKSQLFAIQYISKSSEDETQISLIQGPPGK